VFLFGHAGITLGASAVAAGGWKYRRGKIDWFIALTKYVDIRWLMVGSLLPDIIDKPVGQFFFRDTFHNGRIFAHTLLFLILVTAIGFYLREKQRRTWMLALAAGTFTHLLLDSMWRTPSTLFWPLLGFSFPEIDFESWKQGIFHTLVSNPAVYIPEIIGLAIVLWFGVDVIRRKKVGAFLKSGRVS
jgi:inner membrane protein